jgi:Cys-Gly metallodipeptidase DUG1
MLMTTGSIPVTLDFANILNLNVLLLPVGRGDDGEPSPHPGVVYFLTGCRCPLDQREDRHGQLHPGAYGRIQSEYLADVQQGTKLLGTYMYELAAAE